MNHNYININRFKELKKYTESALHNQAIALDYTDENNKDEVIVILVALIYQSLKELDIKTDRDKIVTRLVETLNKLDGIDSSEMQESMRLHLFNFTLEIYRMSRTKTPQQALEDIITYKPNWFMRLIYQLLELLKFKTPISAQDAFNTFVGFIQDRQESKQTIKQCKEAVAANAKAREKAIEKFDKEYAKVQDNKILKSSSEAYRNLNPVEKIALINEFSKSNLNIGNNPKIGNLIMKIKLEELEKEINKLEKNDGSNTWQTSLQIDINIKEVEKEINKLEKNDGSNTWQKFTGEKDLSSTTKSKLE